MPIELGERIADISLRRPDGAMVRLSNSSQAALVLVFLRQLM